MKNLSLVINAIIAVAVVALYVIQFSGSESQTTEQTEEQATKGDNVIAFINADSVLVNYDYLEVLQDELQKKGEQLEQEYKSRAAGLQREVNDFQQNVNSLTIGQAKALEEDLIKKQQNLRLYQENLSQQLLKEEAKINKELYEKVTSFLKGYSAKNNIDLVVKYNQGSDVLYAGEKMDITDQVIEGLNEAYANATSTAKTDSTSVQ